MLSKPGASRQAGAVLIMKRIYPALITIVWPITGIANGSKIIPACVIAILSAGCVSADLHQAADAIELHGYSDVTVWEGPTSGCSALVCQSEFAATAPNGRRVSGTVEIIKIGRTSRLYLDTGPAREKPADPPPRQVGVPQ